MLINDINKVKEFLPVNKSLEFDKLKPFVVDAERMVSEIIDGDFYNDLVVYDSDPDHEVNDYFDKLIVKLQDSISFLAFHLGFDIMNTVFSNQGMHRIENDESGKKALFSRQEENLKRGFKLLGYNKLDLAFEYMEKNKAQFPTWVASDAYTLSRQHFINSTREFSAIYNINNSRLVFMKVKSAQTLVEDFDIKPLIGIDYYDELKEQVATDSLSDANKAFMIYLQKAVAYQTIFRTGPGLIIELNEFGMYQTEFETNLNNVKKEGAVAFSIASAIIDIAGITGNSYLKSCESFLKKNIDDYPLYANSDAYDDSGDVIEGTDKIVVI